MDKPSELLIANQPLRQMQIESVKKAGCLPVLVESFEAISDQGPYIVFFDNLCISAEAFRLFLKQVRKQKDGFTCAVDNRYYINSYLWGLTEDPDGLVQLPLYYITKPGTLPSRPQVISFDCKKFDRERMPPHMEIEGKGFDHPLTNVIILPIENWVNLWQANIAVLMLIAYELEFTRRYRQIIPLIRALGSIDRVPLYMNKIGKNCNIHPSAVIEASIIGDNVHIGANAVVRLAVVGKGAYISDQALIRVCNIGEGAYIANNNNIAFTIAYPGSFLISGPYQFSIFGQDCAVMHCIDCDTRLDGRSIRADVGGDELIDTKQLYLGSCYGHRVRIGAGTISAPGSAVPNDLWINPDPALVMKDFKNNLPCKINLFASNGKIITKEMLKGDSYDCIQRKRS